MADGRRTVAFARTKPLPSYLLALATGPLETVPIPGMSVPGRVVTVKGASGLAGEAVRTTPPLLAALERYFGRPYPYEKLDLIAVPEFWPGAMENPGAITFRDTILLLDARGASAAQREAHVTINAHELAHMWFGDLVTMEWWDDLWLNESFASWMGDKAAEEAFPELRTAVSDVATLQGAMVTDARLSTRAIRQPVSALDNLLQAADTLAYQKGEAVLGMVEAWVGPEAFRKGVLDYLAAHEWKNASAADLWRALGKAAGKDVGGVLATFLDQPGIPLVEAGAPRRRPRARLPAPLPEPRRDRSRRGLADPGHPQVRGRGRGAHAHRPARGPVGDRGPGGRAGVDPSQPGPARVLPLERPPRDAAGAGRRRPRVDDPPRARRLRGQRLRAASTPAPSAAAVTCS